MQCLCFDKAVHLRVELHSVNSNMFLKGFRTWKNQMAALESTSVHIWAHAGINIDEMRCIVQVIAQLGDRKKFLRVVVWGN